MWGGHSLDVWMGDGGLQPYLFQQSAHLPGEDWLGQTCLHWVTRDEIIAKLREAAPALRAEGV